MRLNFQSWIALILWGSAIAYIIPPQNSLAETPSQPKPPQTIIERPICPTDFKSLAASLPQDLPNYLNRTYTRLGLKMVVTMAGDPDLQPLPVSPSDRPSTDTHQLFISVLEREIGKAKAEKRAYWLFISNTKKGWRLSMAFTRIGDAPPLDVSEGVIANATSTWLRDRCP